MNGDFEQLINNLKGYEEELDLLLREVHSNDSILKLQILAMKMDVVFYKYIIDCFEVLNEVCKDRYLGILRSGLTGLSYALAGVSAFKAPVITIPSLLSCLYLSIKNRQLNNQKYPLNPDQVNELLDLIDDFEDYYDERINSVYEQVDILEDEEVINKLNNPERRKRIACKKLMEFLREDNSEIYMENEEFIQDLKEIIQESLGLSSDNVYELLDETTKYYQQLDDYLAALDKKDNKVTRLYRIIG